MKRIFAMVVVIMLIGTAALAMPIRYNEGLLTLSCIKEGETCTVETDDFQLLGVGQDGQYLIFTDDGYLSLLSITRPITQEQLSRIQEMDATREDDFVALARGSKGEPVRQFQQAMITLGFLNGAADGDFGGMSEKAVMDFQASLGMEQTGVADARLQMLALSMTQPELVLEGLTGSSTSIDTIADRAGIDSQMIYNNGLLLDYDDITGIGFLSDGTVISYDTEAQGDINQYTITMQFGLLLTDKADGTASVEPAVKVGCLCVRRPVINEITVKSGSYRGTASIEGVTAVLDGVKTQESGIAILDEQMVEALANAEDAGELKVRIAGRYNTFDVSVGKEQLASVTMIGKVAQSLQ